MKRTRRLYGWLAALLILTGAFSGTALAAGVPVTAVLTDGEAIAFPEGWPQPPEISAPSAVVADADTGAVLYAKNPDHTCDPGGNAKLMTALLTLENAALTDVITFSNKAIPPAPRTSRSSATSSFRCATASTGCSCPAPTKWPLPWRNTWAAMPDPSP